MNDIYLNIYNNLIKLTRNKNLYNLDKSDTFYDRLIILFFHLSFLLKIYKNIETGEKLQKFFDYCVRQIELSIREIGYGDATINKKMKDYINLFHSMVSEIHFWDSLSKADKLKKISFFLVDFQNNEDLLDYFENFNINLSKKTLNYYLKSVSNP